LEGAALGGAILESLTLRGACTLSTTHLGALKELATQVAGVVNGSLQFDAEQLAPTYRFLKGIPGRSYGISIARRLRLPADVVERAEERVPRVERDVSALLERLEEQQRALTAREEELAQMLDDARARTQRLSARERDFRDKERELERESRQEARKYLLNARAEIDRTLRDLKRAPPAGIETAARTARQQAEQLAARHADALDDLAVEDKAARERGRGRGEAAEPPVSGDLVTVESLGGKPGRVLEVRGADALIAVGSLKMTVPLRALAKRAPDEAVAPVALRGDVPEAEPRGEVDLRGLRIDEMEAHLFRALDDAIRADLPTLRIIHGKGTGALRDRVTEMLRKDARVRQFRLGALNEGGTGVTMADLK
jgi:DNA mismatch repair protein MutS2